MIAYRLAVGDTYEQAAQACGCGLSTVKRRLKEPGFAEQVQSIRDELLRQASGLLASYCAAAAENLMRLVSNEDAKISLGSSKAIFDYLIKIREHDELAKKLDEIKTALKTKGIM